MSCIELIGCTGAGKSTLLRFIKQVAQEAGISVYSSEEAALSQFGLERLREGPVRAAAINGLAFLAAMGAAPRYLSYFQFTFKFLLRLPISWLEKQLIGRNVIKNIGLYEISRRQSGSIVLLDEGPLHIAHALFVHTMLELPEDQIATFVKLVPLSDAILYLRIPQDVLVERTLDRGHRRIPTGSRLLVQQFVEKAVCMFDHMVHFACVRARLIVVEEGQVHPAHELNSPNPTLARIVKLIQEGLNQLQHSSVSTDQITIQPERAGAHITPLSE